MVRGTGRRFGLHTYIRATDGASIGLLNDLANRGKQQLTAISNRLTDTGRGNKTAVRNVLRDDLEKGGSEQNLYGVHTSIHHTGRPQVFGSKIEVQNENGNSDHRAYGQHISIEGAEGGAVSYGLYANVPGQRNYAGYFVGNVTITGNLVETSDARLKTKGRRINRALDIIDALRPKEYTFVKGNRFKYDASIPHYGFMAQEVESVLPALVHDIEHPEILEPIDEEEGMTGTSEEDSTLVIRHVGQQRYRVKHPRQVLKGVRYADLIAILTEAVQEQQVEIEELQAKLSTEADDRLDLIERTKEQYTELAESVEEIRRENNLLRSELAELRNCTDCAGSQVQSPGVKADNASAAIYPNPATDKVTINTQLTAGFQVRIVTAEGKEYGRLQSPGRLLTVNTADWPAGGYVFEITDSEVVVERQAVIIHH